MDSTGFDAAPERYVTGDVEAIDAIWALLGDEGFIAYCTGAAAKYVWRAGKKGPAGNDLEKARWYTQMAAHAKSPDRVPDPRKYRA